MTPAKLSVAPIWGGIPLRKRQATWKPQGSHREASQGSDAYWVAACAGDRELFERVQAPLEVMGKASFFLGEVGAGANMKLVVNMVMGSMMAAFAEGLTLADKVGGRGGAARWSACIPPGWRLGGDMPRSSMGWEGASGGWDWSAAAWGGRVH